MAKSYAAVEVAISKRKLPTALLQKQAREKKVAQARLIEFSVPEALPSRKPKKHSKTKTHAAVAKLPKSPTKSQLKQQKQAVAAQAKKRADTLADLNRWSASAQVSTPRNPPANSIALSGMSDTINWNDTSEDGGMWRR